MDKVKNHPNKKFTYLWNSHPNMFWIFIIIGMWSFTMGVMIMSFCYQKPISIGWMLIISGAGIIISSFRHYRLAKVFMALNLSLSLLLGIGLQLELWQICPHIQFYMWIFYACLQLCIMSEPQINPLTRKNRGT